MPEAQEWHVSVLDHVVHSEQPIRRQVGYTALRSFVVRLAEIGNDCAQHSSDILCRAEEKRQQEMNGDGEQRLEQVIQVGKKKRT